MADHGRANVVKEEFFGDIGTGVIDYDLLTAPFLAVPILRPCRQDGRQRLASQEPIVQGKVEIGALRLDRGNRRPHSDALGQLCGDLRGCLPPGFGERETGEGVVTPGGFWRRAQEGDDGLYGLS